MLYSIGMYQDSGDTQSWLIILIPAGAVVVMGIINIRKLLSRSKLQMDSYLLTITPESIMRELHNTPTILIRKEDIRSIKKGRKGSYLIKGAASLDTIYVPYTITDKEKLEQELSALFSGEISRIKISPVLRQLIFLLITLAAILITQYSDNKYIASGAAIVFLGLAVWSFIFVRKSKNADYRNKRYIWVQLLVALFIAVTTILRFFPVQ